MGLFISIVIAPYKRYFLYSPIQAIFPLGILKGPLLFEKIDGYHAENGEKIRIYLQKTGGFHRHSRVFYNDEL
ncbi:hypothetical protein ACA29_24095 [Lederbergia galactosidilytica]|uniref:Uncharacterized protein n=1 Tax=Lederbergia galactosidilytica TaxID=217031 RepID=A0A0Q9XX68_9BACI|nr:hypothetical protein ACA29_24095 [Lederbergia galactosidilytica]